jgi:CheY-like chemotaxis protein
MATIQGVEHRKQAMRVLIIEDDKASSTLMEAILSPRVEEITCTEEGEEGLKILEEDKNIDLLFLDYHLPKMNGKTFCHIVRSSKTKYNENLWIVAHTKQERELIIEEMFACGINDYLPKPLNPIALVTRLLVAQYNLIKR